MRQCLYTSYSARALRPGLVHSNIKELEARACVYMYIYVYMCVCVNRAPSRTERVVPTASLPLQSLSFCKRAILALSCSRACYSVKINSEPLVAPGKTNIFIPTVLLLLLMPGFVRANLVYTFAYSAFAGMYKSIGYAVFPKSRG